ncbi:MAG: C4-type zinc ribbon domain-containing protein [Deltaproteobacteria bacterium]|nr:C4-type zinc ribbon domain-containing protein [Deltaproteobacteria bacterium]
MEEIRTLLDLQETMSQAHQVESEKNKVPLEVADLKGLFEEKEAKFLAAQQEFEQAKKERREKEREIEEERDKVERAKAKLMTIKTNKEYYAMLKEIDQTKRANSQREEELLAILARYEEIEGRLSELKGEVDEVGGRYRGRMVEIEARMKAFDKDIAALLAKKAEVAARLDNGLVRRFEMIFNRRDGVAIVPARSQGGVASCAGCHMNISPQLFNLLQREDRVYTCPNCNRILYYERPEGEPAGE